MLMLCMAECSDKKKKEEIEGLDHVVNKSICSEIQCSFVDATASVASLCISLPLFTYNVLFPAVKRGYLTLVVLILLPA